MASVHKGTRTEGHVRRWHQTIEIEQVRVRMRGGFFSGFAPLSSLFFGNCEEGDEISAVQSSVKGGTGRLGKSVHLCWVLPNLTASALTSSKPSMPNNYT
jgi:hypothetical protein